MRIFLFRLIGFFSTVLIIFCLLIALLPTVASTNWGRKQVIYWINRSIPGELEFRSLDLQWSKGQIIEGLLLRDPEKKVVLEVGRLSTEATLWQLMKKNLQLDFTQIQGLNATIITNEKGQTNLQRALGIHSSQTFSPFDSSSTIILSDVNMESYLFAPNHPLSFQIKGKTQQNHLDGSFEFNFFLNNIETFTTEFTPSNENNNRAKIGARVVNFPVDLIDHLIALKYSHSNRLFRSVLGQSFNLKIDQESSREGLAFNLTLLSSLLQGDIKGIIKEDGISLKEPAFFHLNLEPQFINSLTGHQINLLGASRLKIVFPNLTIPLNFFDKQATIDPCLFRFKTELTIPKTDLQIGSMGPLEILNVQAHLSSLACDKLVQAELIGQAQQKDKIAPPFDLHFTSSINKPSNICQLLHQIYHNLQFTLTVSHFPLQTTLFSHTYPEWIEKIGPYMNAQLDVRPKGEKEWIGVFSFQTPHITLKKAELGIGKKVVLLSPAQLNWTLPTNCLQTFLNGKKEFFFDQPCSLNIAINRLLLSLETLQLNELRLESSIPHIRFSKIFKWGIAEFNELSLKIESQNLTEFTSNLTGQLLVLNPGETPFPLVPEPLIFKQTSNWKIGRDNKFEMPSSQLQINNSVTQIQINATLDSNDLLTLSQPAQIQYTLSPAAFQILGHLMDRPEWPQLKEKTHFKLKVEPTNFYLKSFSISELNIHGLLEIEKIAFQDPYSLENLVIPWSIDFPKNNIHADIKGSTYHDKNGKPSQIASSLQFWLTPGHYDLLHTRSEIRMNFMGMPTSVLNILLPTPDINPILGPILDLNFKVFFDPTAKIPGYLDIALDSTNFHLGGRFKLNEYATIYDPLKLPTFRLTVTPESYLYLKETFNFQSEDQLTAPFTITGILSKLNLPIKGLWTDHGLFDFQLSTNNIQWRGSSIPIWLKGNLSTDDLSHHVNFSLQLYANNNPIAIEGTLANLFNQEKHLKKWQEINLKTKLNGQQINPLLLQNLSLLDISQTQKLQALFGENLDLNIACQLEHLNGPIQAFVKGTEGHMQLEGQINKGILTLNKPLEGSFNVTPLFKQAFLSSNIPILNTVIGAENPITFTIDPFQFSLPLAPFQIENAKIEKGSLDVGKLHFQNEGEFSSILNIIRPFTDRYLTIWFTPIYIELNQGIISLKRFDMLVGHAYTLASWGKINFLTHEAQFTLGMTAQALQYAFGVQGLDENYILQIPFYIAQEKVKIDKSKITARVASLVTQTQAGTKGKLLSNILDMALSDRGEEPHPPPTVSSFPWQNEFNPSIQRDKNSLQTNTRENQKEIKQKKRKKEKKYKLF